MNMMNNAVNRNGMAVSSPKAAGYRIPTYWTYNPDKNNYVPTNEVPRYAFPTVIDKEKLLVWCRSCNRWEDIKGFSNNKLKTACGKVYAGLSRRTIATSSMAIWSGKRKAPWS